MINYEEIPVEYMVGAVRRYIEEGINPGHFMSAIICNDLRETFNRADLENQKNVLNWLRWFVSYAPANCWGSTENFETWRKHRGFKGMSSE